jgi:four helix bundle protein
MKGHRDLVAWQKAMELVFDIYRLTARFPKEELYGLTSQLRRAAVSVPSNIAEGYGRNSRREFHQFLGHARGSLAEVETQLLIASELNYLTADACGPLFERVARLARLLNGLKAWSVQELTASSPEKHSRLPTTSY